LSQDQIGSWSEARDAEFRSSSLGTTAGAYRQFLATAPPEPFAAAANFALGIIFQRQKQPQAAEEMFELVARKYPAAMSESGIEYAQLAEFKLIELLFNQSPVSAERLERLRTLSLTLCSNAVMKPTALSPYLLQRITEVEGSLPAALNRRPGEVWSEAWDSHEVSRKLYHAAKKQSRLAPAESAIPLQLKLSKASNTPGMERPLAPASPSLNQLVSKTENAVPRLFWINAEESWLAVRLVEDTSSIWFACLSEEVVRQVLRETITSTKIIPEYFGVRVSLCGKQINDERDLRVWFEGHHFGRKGGFISKEYEDSKSAALLAAAQKPQTGSDLLSIGVHLTSPTTLFTRQRARTFWFALLIATATLAALIGLITAWRMFHRQQRLAEMKTNFVSSVSHELRAPIASLRLMAEGLESGRVHEHGKQQEYFRFIVQECRRLSSLIENVLDFSRIEQGRKQYEFEPTDLPALVRNTVQLMQPYADQRQINLKLITDLSPDDSNSTLPLDAPRSTLDTAPHLDGRAIQQALINLIDNALKHSTSHTTVSVGLDFPSKALAERISVPGNSPFRLWVEDQGEGIPAEEQERIFERFYRRGTELRRETQGVGLGLAIVKHVAEAHGGTVLVQSEVGKGSRFVIEIPAKPQSQKKN
jgi:signal transduction histidine kinase